MTNKEIARSFDLLARIMELHNENPFKIKSYQNAYLNLRKLDTPLSSYSMEGLMEIKGIGEAIAEKIQSLVQTGSMPTLEKYLTKTPPGVVEMLRINGLGPKKVAIIWKELGITSPGELLYACNENRLVEHKGFGEKTQQAIIQAIGFLQTTEGKFLQTIIQHHCEELIKVLAVLFPGTRQEITGPCRLGHETVEALEILSTCNAIQLDKLSEEEPSIQWLSKSKNKYEGIWNEIVPLIIHLTSLERWAQDQLKTTGPEPFLKAIPKLMEQAAPDEQELFHKIQSNYIPPELRDIVGIQDWTGQQLANLITTNQIKGIIHCHSTYSDGIHSLEEMAKAAQKAGFSYLAITDHSQAAGYARGMKPDQLKRQWAEIDQLNEGEDSFRIIKGIECDILTNGDLDYTDEILAEFELVIASIHSAFQMDKEKATQRIIKAIENSHTNIIGHPSGRLLLTRGGYPLDMVKIIDACKANTVALELNANPQRLDIDYTLIKTCMDKGVYVAINPDAHNRSALMDIQYGVIAARRGALQSEYCLNTLDSESLLQFCKRK